jgi:predicted deacylase
MTRPLISQGMIVNKSVSLPISVIEAVLDEADLMHESFSGAMAKLAKLGITVRRDERLRDAKRQEAEDQEAIARIKGKDL